MQLTMTTSSIRLLKAEIKREEAELQKENDKLEELGRNAKMARQARKRQSKNVWKRPFLHFHCAAGATSYEREIAYSGFLNIRCTQFSMTWNRPCNKDPLFQISTLKI